MSSYHIFRFSLLSILFPVTLHNLVIGVTREDIVQATPLAWRQGYRMARTPGQILSLATRIEFVSSAILCHTGFLKVRNHRILMYGLFFACSLWNQPTIFIIWCSAKVMFMHLSTQICYLAHINFQNFSLNHPLMKFSKIAFHTSIFWGQNVQVSYIWSYIYCMIG